MEYHTWMVVLPETGVFGLVKIGHSLTGLGLIGVSFKVHAGIKLPPNDLVALYEPGLAEVLRRKIVERYIDTQLTVFHIKGNDPSVVEQIARARGFHDDPKQCAPNTFRYMLSQEIAVVPVCINEHCTFYPNFVLIPQNSEGVLVYDKIFGRFFRE